MGFANMNGLPRIQSFTAAERVYNNIKPIRGTTLRPLGKRRDKHFAIEKISDTKYVCTLYGHRVITYTKETAPGEGTLGEVSLCGYDTMTTRGFITRVLGTDCYSRKDKTYIEVGNRVTEVDGKYKVTGAYYLPANHTLQIRHGKVLNPVAVKKKVIDREVTKNLREKYKESMAEAEAMLNLGLARFVPRFGMSDGGYDPREKISEYRMEFLADLTREEMTEYLWIVGSALLDGAWRRNKTTWNISTQNYENTPLPQPASRPFIVGALYDVVKWDDVDIYKEVELPVGQRA